VTTTATEHSSSNNNNNNNYHKPQQQKQLKQQPYDQVKTLLRINTNVGPRFLKKKDSKSIVKN